MGVTVDGNLYDISIRSSGVYTTTTIGFDKRGADPFTYHITDLAGILPFVQPGKAVTIAGSVGNDGIYTVETNSGGKEYKVTEAVSDENPGNLIAMVLPDSTYGFLTVPTSAEFRRRANDFAPVIGVPGAQLEYAEDIWRPWTLGDFRGGLGQEEWDDPTRFDIMTAGLRIYKNRITLDTQFHDELASLILTKGVDFKANHYAIDQTGSHKLVKKRASVELTAGTISFDSGTKEIRDSNNGLAIFLTGDLIVISGSTDNDGDYTVATGGVAAKIVVSEALTDEGAGTVMITTGHWTTAYTCASDITDICVFGDYLWISTWGSHLYYSQDGAAWNQRTTDYAYSQRLISYREFLWSAIHWKMWFANEPRGDNQWSRHIIIGDGDEDGASCYDVNGLAVIGGIIAIGRTNGIYTYEGSGDRAEGPIIDFENMAWEGNCKLFTVVDGFLYYNVGDRIKKTDLRGAEFDVTPSMTGDTYKELFGFGVPVGGQGRQGHIYVGFAGTKHIGGTYPAVLEMPTIDIGGWRVVYDAGSDLVTRGCWFSDIADRLLVNDGATRTQRSQPQSDAPYPDYVQTASIITSWFDAGDVWSAKMFRKILAWARDLSSTETIKLYYENDYTGTWILIDTLDGGTLIKSFFDPSNIANSARKVRLKIVLSRDAGDSGNTPTLLLPLVVSYIVRPDPVYAQQVAIRLEEGIVTHQSDGGRKTLTAGDVTALKAFLRACEAYPFPVEYTDKYGEAWDVFISRTEELRSFRYPVGLGGEERQEDVMIVTMREV